MVKWLVLALGKEKKDKDERDTYHKWHSRKEDWCDKKWLDKPDRKKGHKPVMHYDCTTFFRIKFDVKIQKYVVTEFVREHIIHLLWMNMYSF